MSIKFDESAAMEEIMKLCGKDITMNVCIQIRAVVDLLQEKMSISFEEAVM